MTAPDLKPCPFCGSAPRLWEHHAGGCEIECVNGHCPSEPHVGMPTAAEAIAAWNTRTDLVDALAVPEDLATRCAEILEWTKTGMLRGNALRAFADASPHKDIRKAETDTLLEAAKIIVALRAIGERADG